ncbi:MAG TPA: CBS domain-containing protein [Acidimicrobiia bacterium]|nr:CBS domain-containing protein [Acidimicrobiia bacterium]
MRVRDVMTAEPVTVREETPLKDIVTILLDHEIGGAPVVDDKGALRGIVTEADVMSREAYGSRRRRPLRLLADYLAGRDPGWLSRASGTTARDVMSPRVVTTHPGEDLRVAARRMLEQRVKRLVVVDGDRIVGIVSRQDLLHLFAVPDNEVTREVEALIADVWRVPEHLDVRFSVDHGVVRLDGSVDHPSDGAVVERAVEALPGVVAVESHLDAREPEPRPMR